MTYELLTSLYEGDGANADLTTAAARRLLHVPTPLERRITTALEAGLDVVLTGNPGDGKSHLARSLQEAGKLGDAEVLLDLSARPTAEAARTWEQLRGARRFVLCANEGPLRELIASTALSSGRLRALVDELAAQLGHLTVSQVSQLPSPPRLVMLIDLADRNVLDVEVVSAAIRRVCCAEFLPELGDRAIETSAGRNMTLLNEDVARSRLARLLCVAGRRQGEHVTFRDLWRAVALAVTGAKAPGTLRAELSTATELGTEPLDHLTRRNKRGLLVGAVRRFCDPASVTDPDLDDALWHNGAPSTGQWFLRQPHLDDPPHRMWREGRREEALQAHRLLKRALALGHTQGEQIIAALERDVASPAALDTQTLRRRLLSGIRRSYVVAPMEATAPTWLTRGVPLWVGLSYGDAPLAERPHVAVRAVGEGEFEVLLPMRPAWLSEALGPSLDRAWLQHRPSGELLAVDPHLLAALTRATETSGPIEVPESVDRFLARVAGWVEREVDSLDIDCDLAVLSRPRGELVAAGRVKSIAGGARYGQATEG